MSLKASIISADERLKDRARVTALVLGPSGVGKTSLARTLDPASTLFIDAEGGTLAIQDWKGGVLDVREYSTKIGVHPWELLRAIVCWLGGPDPAAKPDSPYHPAMYANFCAALGDPAELAHITTLFWDSITVASRFSFDWATRQPQAFSEKTGKPDLLGAYGLHGREMIAWFTQIQHMAGRNNFIVGILDKVVDDLRRVEWVPQIVGGMAGRELPGIFDEVITLQIFDMPDNAGQYRALVCQPNQFGYPAKDRSGRVDMLEPPDLGALMRKMLTGARHDTTLQATLPQAPQPSVMQHAAATAIAALTQPDLAARVGAQPVFGNAQAAQA